LASQRNRRCPGWQNRTDLADDPAMRLLELALPVDAPGIVPVDEGGLVRRQ
jgi:hypothetical protein